MGAEIFVDRAEDLARGDTQSGAPVVDPIALPLLEIVVLRPVITREDLLCRSAPRRLLLCRRAAELEALLGRQLSLSCAAVGSDHPYDGEGGDADEHQPCVLSRAEPLHSVLPRAAAMVASTRDGWGKTSHLWDFSGLAAQVARVRDARVREERGASEQALNARRARAVRPRAAPPRRARALLP